jgi:hypothetical protein
MRDYLRQRWIAEEALILALGFGEIDYDEQDGRWVMLPRFPISRRLGRPSCALLIKLPPAYPAVPPFGVFVDRDLPLDLHYFPESGTLNPHAQHGWAWLCLHAAEHDKRAWRPGVSPQSGDNLLVLLTLVRALLDEAAPLEERR